MPLLVTGVAGVGKTAMAVHLGHRVADRFPDGQLYVELGGPRIDPPDAGAVLAGFLRTLGSAPADLPADLAGRLQAYRSALADRRVLVVLDNAANEQQVRPLLPSGDACQAIVTSRASLGGLRAQRIPLGLLSAAEALELLGGIVGRDRMAAEPGQAELIVRRAGLLPLAVWVAGARLASRPRWKLIRMAGALADENRRLDELAAGDVNVRAGLELTYRALDERSRTAFRWLGLLNTPNLAAWELAALTGTSLEGAAELVDSLEDAYLVETQCFGRVGLHDLVRLHAQEKAAAEEPEVSRPDALRRLAECAVDLAERATCRLDAVLDEDAFEPPRRWSLDAKEAASIVADPLAWFTSDRNSLVAAVDRALEIGAVALAGRLATALAVYFRFAGRHDEWRATHHRVLRSATQAGDHLTCLRIRQELADLATIEDDYPLALTQLRHILADVETTNADQSLLRRYQVTALAGLGYVHRLLGRYRSALDHLDRARILAHEEFPVTVAFSTTGIGVVHLECKQYGAAAVAFEEARELARTYHYRSGEAQALRGRGLVEQAVGDLDAASAHYAEAGRMSVACGDRIGETHARSWYADVQVRQNHMEQGVPALKDCLCVYRSTRNVWGEATVLGMLGRASFFQGDLGTARELADRSVALWRRLGSPYWLAEHLDLLGLVQDEPDPTAAERSRREATDLRACLQTLTNWRAA